jgi:hypothetical protein
MKFILVMVVDSAGDTSTRRVEDGKWPWKIKLG